MNTVAPERSATAEPAPRAMETAVREEAARAVAAMFCPGDVVEVRVPKAGRNKTISGYFDDFEVLAAEVERLEGLRFPGIYWTLNPVARALLARANNKLKSFAENSGSMSPSVGARKQVR